MKIKSTLIVLSLIFGLFACSYNSGVLKEAQPTLKKPSLKSSVVSDSGHRMIMHFRGVNNAKYDAKRGKINTIFDSAGGLLTKITAVRKGNFRLGIRPKSIVIWNQPEHFDDLLYMGTGMMGDLVLLNIPSGVYDYVIVDVSEGWAAKDGKIYPVIFPGHKMILRFDPPVTVGEHLSPDLTFLIDVSHSFIPIHRWKRTSYIFRPFVKVVNATETGSLAGAVVDPSMNPITNAHIVVNANGQTYDGYSMKSMYINPQLGDTLYPGQYWIPGIPPGTYTAYSEKDGYVTDSAQVSIMKGNYYFQNFVLIPH